MSSLWYVNFDGQTEGPLSLEECRQRVRHSQDGFAWHAGMVKWEPISRIAELTDLASDSPPAPPFMPHVRHTSLADDVDYQVFGQEMQYVEIELDPGESAVAEAGTMMHKHPDIRMETVFGDGSDNPGSNGFMGKLLGAGKRLLTGESLFTTVFTHHGHGKARVAFAAPYPGTIIPVALAELGGTLICQRDSFLCAAKGVSIGIAFQRKIMSGLFGGEGFIMQKLEGDGLVFVHAGGCLLQRQLGAGEVLHVDTGCVVGYESGVDFDIEGVGGIKSALFGGEGLFIARLQGPGRVWLQSLPFSRLAGRMLAAAPQSGNKSRGEGSVLGGFGDLIDGDNRW